MSRPSPRAPTGYGTFTPASPRLLHHLELVAGPTTGQQLLAVFRHPFRGALVSRLRELAAVAVREVVHEAVAALEAERFELAFVRHGARPVPLVREQDDRSSIRAFDDEDLGFLA